MDSSTGAPDCPVTPDEAPSPTPVVDARRHWRILPALDHRHGVPVRDRGVLHPGHTRALPCVACAAAPAPDDSCSECTKRR